MLHCHMLVNLLQYNYCAMPVQKVQMELPYILDGGQVEVHEYIIMHIPSSTSDGTSTTARTSAEGVCTPNHERTIA